jgi:murein L,D-transpeptidase YcbB/YkuD
MNVRFKGLLLFSAVAGVPAGFAIAQPAASRAQTASAQPAATAPGAQATQPAQPDPPPAPPLPPPLWTPADANELLLAIAYSTREGLDPNDYDAAGLMTAMRSGNPVLLSAAATERFNQLSSDLALGRVRRADRQKWSIPDPDLSKERQDQLLRVALQQRRVGEALRNLLPTHPQYAALQKALEVTPKDQAAKIGRIRLNMDRWRWLPRDLGERYIIVNVPAYTAALVENGVTLSRHRAVAGAVKTPTPQLMATATGVILNPWWEVPKSIEPEVRGRRGYVALRSSKGDIIRWRQPPGPSNALGQIKFVMPNSQAIYLHDTTARGLFDAKSRAYSHGCIRTEHILTLATKLLTDGDTEWTPERIKEAVASRKTVQANFPKPLPVYIVYMSSAALGDGSIKDYADIYKKDGKVLAALNDVPAKKADAKVASR